jgi:hypothetical protein
MMFLTGSGTVANVIDITRRLPDQDNLITARPLEFRRGEWQRGYAMMCSREESKRFESHRVEALHAPGHEHISFVPNHISLDGGYHYTILGLFRHRHDEDLMRRVYRLAGMMECVTSVPSAVLRTDLLRRFYKTIFEERDKLDLVWRGDAQRFLLPIHPELRHPNILSQTVSNAESLKDLYLAIESETDAQFDILASSYVFYLPTGFFRYDSHSDRV